MFVYSYDAWNRMVRVTKAYRNPSSPSTVSLGSVISVSEYDAPGRRIVKAVQNSGDLDCTHHYYFERQSIIEERDGSDLVLKQYVWNTTSGGYIDELVRTTINGEPVDDPEMNPSDPDHDARHYFALHNANYNVMAIVDNSGGLTERYEYTPYGERQVYFSSGSNDPLAMSPTSMSRRVDAGGVDQPYGLLDVGHQGLSHDDESGLIGNRARMLHPRLGRFAQRDFYMSSAIPSALDGYQDGLNLYQYTQSNPNYSLDPTGMYTLGDAFASACRKKGGYLASGRSACIDKSHKFYITISTSDTFDEWVSLEHTRGSWWTVLPKCPGVLCVIDDKKAINPDPTKWKDPVRPSKQEKILHPGAYWSLRSKSFGGHYNQCIYDVLGQLYTTPPTAGTVDWKASGTLSHFNHDVYPVMIANELDGGGDIDILTPWPGGSMKSPAGPNVKRYYEVRPSWY